ncbi:MAG TPA: aspartate--tRNA ligase [Candidatus Acidoferrum sp.]|nr:aspartate--tRNA ligase [Candidatus Acidoferrum sp.]
METVQGLKRTKYCGEFRAADIGSEATVFGWVQKVRNLGGLLFIDLRDRTGLLQCTFDESVDKALFDKAFPVRGEYVLAVKGVIRPRGEAAVNDRMPTGAVELLANELRILNTAKTPPFEIVENTSVNEELRLKYRYLDLRRPDLAKNILLRSKTYKSVRDYFADEGFIEIETPVLMKSTPEGARDYLVPSRVHPGKFYALPQSPQQYKQILMVSGFDRYIQIARCFRDEDLRADRQPDFTQIDLEMSFVDRDDIIAVNEGLLKKVWKDILGLDIEMPFMRLTYKEAMERFGSDKPDLRFGLELTDLTDTLKGCEFKVFAGAIEAGGSVRCITVKGGFDKLSRKEIDALAEYVKTYRAKGLAWVRMGEEMTSSFAKFLKPEELSALLVAAKAEKGDVVLIVADADKVVFDSLGALRGEVARRLDLIDKSLYKFLWVTEFPLLEFDEEAGRFVAMHHPFTSPMDEDLPLLDTDPGKVRAKAYDIVLNGYEIGGGSIRIYNSELQSRMFSLLGFTKEQAKARFGFLMDAFEYGAPPHGGLAFGLDRLVMLLAGCGNIRDVIAFPKVQNASELMSGAPDFVDDVQLDELSIALTRKEED